MVGRPSPRFVGDESPTAILALAEVAICVRRPAARNVGWLPARAPFRQLNPATIGVERITVIKIITFHAHLVGLLVDGATGEAFISSLSFRSTAASARCHSSSTSAGRRRRLFSSSAAFSFGNELVSQRIQTKGRAARFLRDRNSRCGITVPDVAIIDVINLIRTRKTSRRSPRIVFVKKPGLRSILSVAKERKIDLPVLSGGRTNVNAQVIGRTLLKTFRIEHNLNLRVVATRVIK
jgi:hypothetical protein